MFIEAGSQLLILCCLLQGIRDMNHLPLRKTVAPSATILKFLRAQIHEQPYFTANHAPHHARKRIASPAGSRGGAGIIRRPRSSSRSMTTVAPLLEASIIPPLSSLFRRGKDEAVDQRPHVQNHFPAHGRTQDLPLHNDTAGTAWARYASTSTSTKPSGKGWREWRSGLRGWRGLWGSSRHKGRSAESDLQPNDLPPLNGFMDDSASLGRVVPRLNELRLRCTEFDEHGNVLLTSREFKKSELIAKVRTFRP